MHYIIEGVDGTGKTTLANDLSRRYGMPVISTCPTTGGGIVRDVFTALLIGAPCIFDRLHVSELVYGPRYREVSRIGLAEYVAIEAVCGALGTVNLYCFDTTSEVMRRIGDGQHHPRGHVVAASDVQYLRGAYEAQLCRSGLPWVNIRFGTPASAVPAVNHSTLVVADRIERARAFAADFFGEGKS